MPELQLLGELLIAAGLLALLEAATAHYKRKTRERQAWRRIIEADVYGRCKELREQ